MQTNGIGERFPEVNFHEYGQIIFKKVSRLFKGGKDRLLNAKTKTIRRLEENMGKSFMMLESTGNNNKKEKNNRNEEFLCWVY